MHDKYIKLHEKLISEVLGVIQMFLEWNYLYSTFYYFKYFKNSFFIIRGFKAVERKSIHKIKRRTSSIYKFGLGVCLCLFVSNKSQTQFFVGHHATTGKVYEWSKFQIFVSIKIRSSLNGKFWKSAKFFVKIRELFLFCFTMYQREHVYN